MFMVPLSVRCIRVTHCNDTGPVWLTFIPEERKHILQLIAVLFLIAMKVSVSYQFKDNKLSTEP